MNESARDAPERLHLNAPRADDTAAFASQLAPALRPGDVLCLYGPLGAGKSHFARAVIRCLLGDPDAEVASPTYTLVNVYGAPADGAPEIWHADLYRVNDPEELGEIGLDDAAGHAILLVEWAERWPRLPPRRLDIEISVATEGARALTITLHGENWGAALCALSQATPG